MQKVIVNQNTCIGCGVCAALCPQVYEMSSEDGKSYVKAGADHNDPGAREGEMACPVNAITVEEVAANDNFPEEGKKAA